MGSEEYNEIKKEVDKIELTDNLYCKNRNETHNALYYLNGSFGGDLDKGFYAVLSYITYPGYEKFKLKSERGGYGLKNAKNCKCSQFYLESEEGNVIAGDVLNSTKAIYGSYKENVDGEKNFSENSKMFFHLATTVGNVMPWPNGFNPNVGLIFDIFQEKFPKYLSLYEWMRMVGKLNEGWEHWIKGFVDNHYLQDFVNDNKTEALIFYDKTITDSNIRWNLYFYRASKAIMKRSYRILTKKNPNKNKELTDEFIKFCKTFNEEDKMENEIKGLIDYLGKEENNDKMVDDKFLIIEGKEIKNELEEMKALIDKL